MTPSELQEVFTDIILGNGVHRSKHDLAEYGTDLTPAFTEALLRCGFSPMTVGETAVEPGQRIPAFYLRDQTAYFGWVFWEKFSRLRLRKLFGTVVRNTKGDWLYHLPSNSTTIIYTDPHHILEMDIDRPFEL
jgi:hypothetical protein